MGITVPFPDQLPPGYSPLSDEVLFDPERHLQLELPAQTASLQELGYAQAEIDRKATPFAVSTPFRLLSDEGTEIMLDTARRLRQFASNAGDRVACMTRGGCYRSRWLRDLCTSQQVTNHLSTIYGIELAPHAMPSQLGHINYDPPDISKAIDKWHHDTLALDYVMMVTDPNQIEGGGFEYFLGTRDEAAALAAEGKTPPPERVVIPEFPAAGYVIALHGDMVVHRAAPLAAPAERITMVNGYTSMDTSLDEQARNADLLAVDDPVCVWTEWAKFAAWRSQQQLAALQADLEFTSDRDRVIEQLESAIADVQRAIDEMRQGERPMSHYGG